MKVRYNVMGVLLLVRPYFWVQPNVVEVPALIGPLRRRFPYQWLEIDGGKLFTVREDGTRKKVPVARWFANSADWAAVTRVTNSR